MARLQWHSVGMNERRFFFRRDSLDVALNAAHIHFSACYSLAVFISFFFITCRQINVSPICLSDSNGGGKKLMVVNRIFLDGLLGLRSYSRNEGDSYNLEAAGRSFVPRYTHINQPTPFQQAHTHTRSLTMSCSVDRANSVDPCFARQSSVPFLCNLRELRRNVPPLPRAGCTLNT